MFGMPPNPDQHTPRDPADIPIIGLAGAIGAGKSTLAAALARRGCLVIDSDREARTKLDDPAVKQQLLNWWGPTILDTEGNINRRTIADRIFQDAAARKQLESLIHPLIRRTRPQAQHEAARAGAIAIVYDAPLLFEAGIDAICDITIFVDAPRDARLQRLAQSRAWTEAELDRREAMQWSLNRKKAAATLTIPNEADPSHLDEAAQHILQHLGLNPDPPPGATT